MASVDGFDPGVMRQLQDDMVAEYHRTSVPQILAAMRAAAPFDTGLTSISHLVDRPKRIAGGFLIRFRVATSYAIYPHQGHGEIRPVRGKALRWVNKQGVVVFARRVRPVAANPWLYRAFARVGLRDPRHLP
jgi:hypothetical protein